MNLQQDSMQKYSNPNQKNKKMVWYVAIAILTLIILATELLSTTLTTGSTHSVSYLNRYPVGGTLDTDACISYYVIEYIQMYFPSGPIGYCTLASDIDVHIELYGKTIRSVTYYKNKSTIADLINAWGMPTTI